MKPALARALRSFSVVGAILFCVPLVAFAQAIPITTEPLTLSISPQYPRPGENVAITPQSSTVALSNSTMVVTVNGAQVYTGNTRAVSVKLSAVGKTTTITATIKSQGRSYSKSVSLAPGDVALVAEPLSTVPALYAGKGLVPIEGSVRIVAAADFRSGPTTRLDPLLLAYTWSVNGSSLPNASGIGKNSLTITSPLQYRNEDVSVVVTSPGGSTVGGDTISLVPQTPTLRIYEEDPLSGILFDHIVQNSFTIPEAEATLIAVPYTASLSAGIPSFNWFLNGQAAQSGPEITLRPNGGGSGNASLSVTMAQNNSPQTISANLSVIFGKTSSNIFGL